MDSSANKGGVTGSSLGVLAGVSLSREEYQESTIFKDGKPCPFYEGYVWDIQQAITENAAKEFGCIWHEPERLQGEKPLTLISDELSRKLNELQEGPRTRICSTTNQPAAAYSATRGPRRSSRRSDYTRSSCSACRSHTSACSLVALRE